MTTKQYLWIFIFVNRPGFPYSLTWSLQLLNLRRISYFNCLIFGLNAVSIINARDYKYFQHLVMHKYGPVRECLFSLALLGKRWIKKVVLPTSNPPILLEAHTSNIDSEKSIKHSHINITDGFYILHFLV